MAGLGIPDWQVKGIIELWDSAAAGKIEADEHFNLDKVLGRKSTTAVELVAMVAPMFK